MVSIRKLSESEVIRTTNIRTEAEYEIGESEQYPVRSESGPVRLQPELKNDPKKSDPNNPVRIRSEWSDCQV